MATVIQLSFLAWTHNREQLASLMVSSMRKRSDSGLGNGIGEPSVDHLMSTLAACSSQTSNFDWSFYTEQVQNRLKAGIPTYQFSADYIRLTPALFLGAMDFLYMAQRFKERRVVVTNEIGSITLIVWAHYILGLNVSVTGIVSGPIVFGDSRESPQVMIEWTRPNSDYAGELYYPKTFNTEEEGPEIHLLDSDMKIILRCIADEDDRNGITCEDRHPLLGWGRIYLRRLFNTSLLTADQDPIYEEAIYLITALAVNISKRLDRNMEFSRNQKSTAATRCQPLNFEYWRVKDAAAVLFKDFKLDEARIESYVTYLSKQNLTKDTCPTTFTSFLNRVVDDDIEEKPAERLMNQVRYLARIVLIFSNVPSIESCAKIPLRMTDDIDALYHQMNFLFTSPNNVRATIEASEIFHALATLLSGRRFSYIEDVSGLADQDSKFLFLYSDFGWSIMFDTIGNKDPADITAQLVHIKPGTPINDKTGERKYQLRDGIRMPKGLPPHSYPLLAGSSKVPRCAAKLRKRLECWEARNDEFKSTLFFTIEPSPEWRKQMASSSNKFEIEYAKNGSTFEQCAGYREMQESIWRCHLTPPECVHPATAFGTGLKSLQIGPDIVELLGWDAASDIAAQRILVLLTRDDPSIRWCAVLRWTVPRITDTRLKPRRAMLRAPRYCDQCALNHVASQSGRWVLIL